MSQKPTFVVLAAVLAVLGCEDEPEAPEVIRPVRYVVVEGHDSATRRTFSGVSKSGQESRLSFQVSGQVLEVPINVGDRVKKGDTVARMDPADYALQLQNAQAAAAQSRAQERNAKATYERTRALYENQNASRQDLDADRTGYESGRAGLESANQQIRLRQRQLGYTHLKAPEPGVIATVDIEVNEYVQAGELVATLLAGDQIEVSVSVPASVIRSVKKGAKAMARFDSLDGKTFSGTVTEVGVSSAGGATTFPVTVRLSEGENQVRAGMTADVTFVFASTTEGPMYSLPISAVGEDREGRFVFMLQNEGDGLGTVHRSPVEVGEILSDGIEILSGVEPGNLVVTAGVSRIYDGLQVRVPERPGSEPGNVAPDQVDQANQADQPTAAEADETP